ncbi:hypothetical protein [Alkalilimnicola sp. S0819]|uniref:hypothetical protein n=1 Tax=Alkalilimnicola sp. S0819 TaxID=2613922 RepID=UPI00126215B3|nr:hypothetical protein [Alkalilimnicola sp. S0819]KAB7627844.1 hypothetical protein F3N43_02395 [Alkalilimnicola sp. S0819]MPQ15478.1 hypothetical protein [Alkalilimnicola sp. S0819]
MTNLRLVDPGKITYAGLRHELIGCVIEKPRGRERYYNALEDRIADVTAAICGHSRMEKPLRLGKHWIIGTAIDQGSYLSVLTLGYVCAATATPAGN